MIRKPTRRIPLDRRRRGAVAILAAILLIAILAWAAFALDLGYIVLGRTQAQGAADSAAMAAAWQLLDARRLIDRDQRALVRSDARNVAVRIAAEHRVCGTPAAVDANATNDLGGDVVIGRVNDDREITTDGSSRYFNAVQVRVRRTEQHHGRVPLFFGGAFGLSQATIEARAIAEFRDEIRGFRPTSGENLPILPFSVRIDSWQNLRAGSGSDNWTYSPATSSVTAGADGVKELNLVPLAAASGNCGEINIGNSGNVNDLKRQISEGVAPGDLSGYGGSFQLGSEGTMSIAGDTALDSELSDALPDALGKTRILPMHGHVSGTGHNATFSVVGFTAVKIVSFNLSGSNKYIRVQPALLVTDQAIAGGGISYEIFRPVRLVQ